MTRRYSTWTLASASMLGILAVAAVVTGVIFLFGAWVISDSSWAVFSDVGGTAVLLIALLIIAYGLLDAISAWMVWTDRPAGRVLGIISGLIAVLAAAAAILMGRSGDALPMLWIAMVIGALAALPLLVPEGRSMEEAAR
ncbi:MAG TPA: hypothetical protein VFJ03_00720 [Candidatus Limnocylindria bacterium]|jgi:hypothetical protein|nr:hypothetical protein [Candidatus Limnocylindria bacterium]